MGRNIKKNDVELTYLFKAFFRFPNDKSGFVVTKSVALSA
jgi:hypothetical protein